MLNVDDLSDSYRDSLEDRYDHDLEEAFDECNEVISDLEDEGVDTEWVGAYECLKMLDRQEEGFDLSGSDRFGRGGKIVVPDQETAVLFRGELEGQLSDGMWENHWNPYDGWKDYVGREIEVDPGRDSVKWEPEPSQKVDFREFIEDERTGEPAIGRMLFQVRMSGTDADYSRDDLMADFNRIGSTGRYAPEPEDHGF